MSQYTIQLGRSQPVRSPLISPYPHLITVTRIEPIQTAEEDDEEAQLKELQAALAM